MALGALIGAYQEDDSRRASRPASARRPDACSNIRCAAPPPPAPRRSWLSSSACPQALQDAFERLRLDGIGVFPVSDVEEAVEPLRGGLD